MFVMACIPAQVVVWYNTRNNLKEATTMIYKSSAIFAFTGISFLVCGYMNNKFMEKVSDKYLGNLSDKDLRIFKNQARSKDMQSKALVASEIKKKLTSGYPMTNI